MKQLKINYLPVRLISITLLLLSCYFNAFSQPDSLQIFRKNIDSLDYRLIQLLGQRMEVVTSVGKYKAAHNIAPLQSKRFEEIVQKNIVLGRKEQLSEAFIRKLMDAIHEESLAKENEIKIRSKNTK